ncbi:MAG: LacI family DNA-binding transcriptional regulator [Brevundimonas sp.]|uniref:LacI family DNA-binding transcriptional regulator n=1 Tax=Brevundimonas sp. TaxID=1871086 RepID=UPI0027330FA4|nr:LacI family DNA-binding transcriptional regulator [Brevundimonas sp.]MDP3377412.1 LacI family DNA-binding transcriptional regulator [Brevundimonas sp.]
MAEPRPTIRDLAARLGVSHTTVSLALRNDPSISAGTRQRVRLTAQVMGYRGNILVSALLSQVRKGRLQNRGEVVAVWTALPVEEWLGLPSMAVGMAQARTRARELGLRLEVFSIGARGQRARQVGHVMESRGYRALLLPPLPTDLLPLRIDWSRFAVATLGYSFSQVESPRVANAHFNGIMTCYRELRKMGCERIGLVLKRDDDARARHYWSSGFMGAPLVHGGAALPPLLTGLEMDRRDFETWFRRNLPDAIIGLSRDVLLDWLEDMGATMPRDICYACLDIIEGQGRELAGIRQSWGDIFATGVELLAGQLSRNEIGLPKAPTVTLIDGCWHDGPTAAARGAGRL